MQLNESLTCVPRGGDAGGADDPGRPRCAVYVAHRRHLFRIGTGSSWTAWKPSAADGTALPPTVTGSPWPPRCCAWSPAKQPASRRRPLWSTGPAIPAATRTAVHGCPEPVCEVSISHSGDVVAVAVTRAGPVGVDVEQFGAAIHRSGLDGLHGIRNSQRRHSAADFYAYWTRKEAVLKATGEGLRRTMNTIDVTPPRRRPPWFAERQLGCRVPDDRLTPSGATRVPSPF